MKSGKMKHEITLFDTMGPNGNGFFSDTPSFRDYIWSCVELFSETFNIR